MTVERARDVDVEAAPLERIARRPPAGEDHREVPAARSGDRRAEAPPGTSVSLIVRDDSSFTPDRRTALRRGDDILIVTPRKDRDKTEKRLQSISRGGRLAGWGNSRGKARGEER